MNKELENDIAENSYFIEQKLSYMCKILKECRMFHERNHKHHKAKQQIIRMETLKLQKLFKQFRKFTNKYKKIRIRKKNGN